VDIVGFSGWLCFIMLTPIVFVVKLLVYKKVVFK
jgi:hypothetical protein